jgi:hypothetical protein
MYCILIKLINFLLYAYTSKHGNLSSIYLEKILVLSMFKQVENP